MKKLVFVMALKKKMFVIAVEIGEYWGTDPIYYVDSKNKEEDGAAKLCCKILEAIRVSRGGIDGENS
jgi:hypothetical protein